CPTTKLSVAARCPSAVAGRIRENSMAPTTPTRSIKVLFIGNSFTQRNNLPELFSEMAQARGWHIEYELISVGGASLRRHWNDGRAAKAIETGSYDTPY